MEKEPDKLSTGMQILREQVNQMRKQMYVCNDESLLSTDLDDSCSSDFKNMTTADDSESEQRDGKISENPVVSADGDEDNTRKSVSSSTELSDGAVQKDTSDQRINAPFSVLNTISEECINEASLANLTPPSSSVASNLEHRAEMIVSEPTDESNDVTTSNEKERMGRKRKRTPRKREERTRKYNHGIQHENTSGKNRDERKVRTGCNETCKRKCKDKVPYERRRILLKAFWDLGSNTRRWDFVNTNVHESAPKYRRSESLNSKKSTRQYTFINGTDEVVVCKKFFLDTLDISETLVSTALSKRNEIGFTKTDQRGRHANRPRALIDERVRIRDHISSFPVVPSHYCRQSSSRKYLESSLSIQHMHRLYAQKRAEEQADHIAGLTTYKEVFYNEFNLGFHIPKKDACEKCSVFQKASGKTEEMINAHEQHTASARAVREYRDKVKKIIKTNPTLAGATFDLEQVLPLPKSTESVLYYKRKLNNYNLSIFDFESATGFNYLWNETVAKRGSVDIASCVYKYLLFQAQMNKKSVSLFSDSCGGQNRNRNFAAMLWHTVQTSSIDEIEHVFFIRGHSENESDSIHSRIEHASKHASIYTTEQWASVINTSKRNMPFYKVELMTKVDFVDFKDVTDGFANTSKTTERENVRWLNIRKYVVKKGDPCITVHYSMDGEKTHLMNLFQTGRKSFELKVLPSLKIAYDKPLPIDKSKAKDLIGLCESGVIPAAYHQFYHDIPVADGQIKPISKDATNSIVDE